MIILRYSKCRILKIYAFPAHLRGNAIFQIRGVRLVGYIDGANGSKYFYNFNAHGDVVGAVGGLNSTAQTRYTYDAFGNASRTGTSANPFQYCGEYTDNETGLLYLRARYYDPVIGRFISEDPARDGKNWYICAGDNPVRFMDPSGLEYIVVSGGKYYNGDGYTYEFVETALRKIWEWKANNPDEPITWAIAMAGWTEDDLTKFRAAIGAVTGINIIGISDKSQLINYINSKSTSNKNLTNARKEDKITKFAVFSHGLSTNGGTIELGYGFQNRKQLSISKNDIQNINAFAFYNPNSAFYSCNTGTSKDSSFAQAWVNKVGGKTWAFVGKSNYSNINNGNPIESKWAHFIGTFYWGGSANLPEAGKTPLPDGTMPYMATFTKK